MTKLSVDQALLQAKSYLKKGEIVEAQNLYEAVLQKFPKNKRAWEGLSALSKNTLSAPYPSPPQENLKHLMNLYNQGQLAMVVQQAQGFAQQYPRAFIVWNLLGAALKGLGRINDATEAFSRVTQLNPNYAEGFNNLGVMLQDQGKAEEAIHALNKAISINPKFAEAYNNLGNTLRDQNKLDEAVEAYNRSLVIKPDNADTLNNLGATLKDKDNLEEAIYAFKRAISIMPNNAEAFNNLGVSLKDQDKLVEALEAFRASLSIKPDYAEAYTNLGVIFREQGKFEDAINNYQIALSFKPDHAEALYNMSFPYLIQGNLVDGLKFWEWRIKIKKRLATPARAKFIWTRDKILKGSQFFVYEEQGLGDIIQFCRYLPLLEQKGAIVNFKVTPKLHALLQTMKSKVHLTASFPNENEIDIEAPLMSLPHLFNTELETIPSAKSYLAADPDKVSKWSNRLSKDRYKIGICWQGSKTNIDVGRSFPLSHFRGISKLSDVELISLHKGDGEDQIRDVDFDVTTFRADFDDGEDAFVDTAAVMINCDLIITSDTAIAHLAGALGCQTWVALKHIPDWRWMLDRSDSPWYPTMTLFRQKTPGDWACVFDAINKNLRILLDQRG